MICREIAEKYGIMGRFHLLTLDLAQQAVRFAIKGYEDTRYGQNSSYNGLMDAEEYQDIARNNIGKNLFKKARK